MSGVNSIHGSPFFSPFLFKGLGSDPAALALASVLAGPGGELLSNAAEQVIKAVTADPKEAARLLREATQLVVPVIKEVSKFDSDDGTSTVVETTTTVRTERRANYSKTTTTKTSTKERTTDPVKQQEKLGRDLAIVQKLVDGLESGKIQVGDSSLTFDQIQELVKSLIQFLEKGSVKEEPPIDIGNEKTGSPYQI